MSEEHVTVVPEMNRLRLQVLLQFPPEVRTVGAAARYLLDPSGYRLSAGAGPDTQAILARPLMPHVHSRALLPIEDALLLAAGDDVRLVVDHPNKLVTFERW